MRFVTRNDVSARGFRITFVDALTKVGYTAKERERDREREKCDTSVKVGRKEIVDR